MLSTRPSRRARLGVPLSLALGLLLAVSGSVMADTELGHTGMVGAHGLRDASDNPGVTCNYSFNGVRFKLASIKVRAPRVLAADRDSNKIDHRRVGWRFIVQKMPTGPGAVVADAVLPGGVPPSWTNYYKSPVQKATAYENAFAPFSPMTRSISTANDGARYRVLIKMFWYRRDGSKEGTAIHLVDYYRWQFPTGDEDAGPGIYCYRAGAPGS